MPNKPLRGSPEVKPPATVVDKQYPEASSAEARLHVGNGQREPWPQFDETHSPNLTGKYRDVKGQFHLFINQAGSHIELLIALVENDSQWPLDHEIRAAHGVKEIPKEPWDARRLLSRVFRLGGDVSAASTFKLYLQGKGAPLAYKGILAGTLKWSKGGDEVELDIDIGPNDLLDTLLPVHEPWLEFVGTRMTSVNGAKAERYDSEPNFFEQYLDLPDVLPELRTQMWFPLTPAQEKNLGKQLLLERLALHPESYELKSGGGSFSFEAIVRTFLEKQTEWGSAAGTLERGRLRNLVTAANELVSRAYSAEKSRPVEAGGFSSDQAHRWRDAALQRLGGVRIKPPGETERTLLTYTYAMVAGSSKDAETVDLEQTLGIRGKRAGEVYFAEAKFLDTGGMTSDAKKAAQSKWGESLLDKLGKTTKQGKKWVKKWAKKVSPFTTMKGEITIRKEGVGAFTATYEVKFYGLQFSKGVGFGSKQIKTQGTATWYGTPWQPQHLNGVVQLIDFGAEGHVGKGLGRGLTALNFHGSDSTKPPGILGFDFSGPSGVTGIAGAEGSMSTLFGIATLVESDGGEVGLVKAAQAMREYSADMRAGPIHFPVNGARLTEAGTELLGAFGACELPTLGDEELRVRVRGSADKPDGPLRNLLLSRNRAVSAFNYLKNILGKDFAVPALDMAKVLDDEAERVEFDKWVIVMGLDPKDSEKNVRLYRESEKFQQRNDVLDKNDELLVDIISLGEWGALAKEGAKKPGTEDDEEEGERTYDVSKRRAEVEIVGHARLGIHRKLHLAGADESSD